VIETLALIIAGGIYLNKRFTANDVGGPTGWIKLGDRLDIDVIFGALFFGFWRIVGILHFGLHCICFSRESIIHTALDGSSANNSCIVANFVNLQCCTSGTKET
jgi:hypothetical protein